MGREGSIGLSTVNTDRAADLSCNQSVQDGVNFSVDLERTSFVFIITNISGLAWVTGIGGVKATFQPFLSLINFFEFF